MHVRQARRDVDARQLGLGARQALRTQTDAQLWLDRVTTSVVLGNYVDPGANTITFAAFFEQMGRSANLHTRHQGVGAAGSGFGDVRGCADGQAPALPRLDVGQVDVPAGAEP